MELFKNTQPAVSHFFLFSQQNSNGTNRNSEHKTHMDLANKFKIIYIQIQSKDVKIKHENSRSDKSTTFS